MMPLAKRAGSAYLSFGLLAYGFTYDEAPAPPRPAGTAEASAPSGAGRVLGEVARGAAALTRRPHGWGGEAGAGGAAVPRAARAHEATSLDAR
jgi:hypothetical protein